MAKKKYKKNPFKFPSIPPNTKTHEHVYHYSLIALRRAAGEQMPASTSGL